ncbi:MAG: biotin/lipoyl-binding protein [Saprospirales bacterium]|nr:MAG: biotin/lipoyl-binding protein [Saprospirales bacterium]
MKNKLKEYQVRVNESGEIILSDEELLQKDIVEIEDAKYHLLLNGKSLVYEIQELDLNSKKMKVKSNGKIYDIEIKDELDQLIESMGMELEDGGAETDVPAPMPGLVLEISVAEGDEVKKGDPLLILEAMKMENVIKSPGDAKVSKINVKPKDSVEKGAVLIEFE